MATKEQQDMAGFAQVLHELRFAVSNDYSVDTVMAYAQKASEIYQEAGKAQMFYNEKLMEYIKSGVELTSDIESVGIQKWRHYATEFLRVYMHEDVEITPYPDESGNSE
jgi:hypothetical protein